MIQNFPQHNEWMHHMYEQSNAYIIDPSSSVAYRIDLASTKNVKCQ